MAFCHGPWAADMPSRTKSQKWAKLRRAEQERDLHEGSLKHIIELANDRRRAYLDADAIAREMRIRLA